MLERFRLSTLQRFSNRLNQFKTATDEWLEGEEVYTQLYLARIKAQLRELGAVAPLNILDGGCGVGRMAIPLALEGHRVTGIEIHHSSVDLARREAEKAGASCEWIAGDLLAELQRQPDAHYDLGMCVNVLYTCVQWREIIDEMCRVLKPGGLFVGTFRTRFYFISTLLRQGQIDMALEVLTRSEGALRISKLPSYYNWQTPPELREIFDVAGLDVLDMRGTGLFSGSHYDGPAAIIDIDTLSADDLRKLLELESADYPGTEGSGRFTFVVGRLRP